MLEASHSYRTRRTGLTFLLIQFACLILLSGSTSAQDRNGMEPIGTPSLLGVSRVSPERAAQRTSVSKVEVPLGTILPVLLGTTISPAKAKSGKIIRGQIAQDVPLPSGSKIPKGSKVEGHVVENISAENGMGAKISIRFDTLRFRDETLAITTNLRAIAGFMAVLDAGIPNQAVGEGDVSNWMTTTQIGGDSVFGIGGQVTSAHNATEVVGKSPMSGGVLVELRPNASANCRGPLNGNNNPQALWVFSSDACGTYGLSKVNILHAGRTAPVGTVILDLRGPNTKIQRGAGLLLRVIA
jgi:hypothetical protein